MSILPASELDKTELALLGNNLSGAPRASGRVRRRRAQLRAVNRSLSLLGEQVKRLYPPTLRPTNRPIADPA